MWRSQSFALPWHHTRRSAAPGQSLRCVSHTSVLRGKNLWLVYKKKKKGWNHNWLIFGESCISLCCSKVSEWRGAQFSCRKERKWVGMQLLLWRKNTGMWYWVKCLDQGTKKNAKVAASLPVYMYLVGLLFAEAHSDLELGLLIDIHSRRWLELHMRELEEGKSKNW